MHTITLKNGHIYSRTIEINIVDHCNLSCESCAHFSPLSRKGFISIEKLRKNLTILAGSFRLEYVELLGGEPLLNPNISEIADTVRHSGITQKIKIGTNGVLLPKMPSSFWQNIDEVCVSEYPRHRLEGKELNHCIEMARSHGVRLEILHHSHFRKIYSEKGTEDNYLIKRIYYSCQIAHVWNCYTLWDNYFFKCPQSIFMQQHLNSNTPIVDGIRISDTSDFHDQLLEYLHSLQPLVYCKHCLGSVGRLFPHKSISNKNKWYQEQKYSVEELLDTQHLETIENDRPDETSLCFTRSIYEAEPSLGNKLK